MTTEIDITDTIESLRSSFVSWGTVAISTAVFAIPPFEFLDLPIIRDLFLAALKGVLTVLSKEALMEAFFLNTILKKENEAQVYSDVVKAKNNLPGTATRDEVKNAEEKEMDAFRNLVLLTR